MKRLSNEELNTLSETANNISSGSMSSWYFNRIQTELLLRLLDKLERV